jgi:histidine triad (HIT) family protein
MDCLFCKISNNEIPSFTIYEDEIVKVFLDIHPNADGHMLIIPKKHYINIVDIDLDTLNYINKISKKMYDLVLKTFDADGVTISQNNGCVQDIKHFHVHIIPRYSDDKLKPKYPHSATLPLEDVYKQLLNNLD